MAFLGRQTTSRFSLAGRAPAFQSLFFLCLVAMFGLSLLPVSADPRQRTADEVLVVYNANSRASVAVATYYQQKRGITHMLPVTCPDAAVSTVNENIPLSAYTTQIANPVKAYLAANPGINFIVLMKGVPIRISGTDLGYINPGSYSAYKNIDLTGATTFKARIANPNAASTIQVRLDSPTGTLIGTCPVKTTGGYQIWASQKCKLIPTTGVHTLYLVYGGGFNVEWFSFSNSTTQYQATAFDSSYGGVQGEPSVEGGSTVTGSQPVDQTGVNYTPSVDSYLAAIDYPDIAGAKKASLTGSGATGKAWVNRYFNSTVPFTHAQFGGYLVTRLDGLTWIQAMALVDHALTAEKAPVSGSILFDVEPDFGMGYKSESPLLIPNLEVTSEAPYYDFNADMLHMADILEASNIPCEVSLTESFAGHERNLLGYFSWGSNDDYFDVTAYQSLYFSPGAIGDTAVSTSARSFRPLNDGGQSLITDLIRHGITGVRGYVNEPLLDAISSPTLDMSHYLAGYTLAESFYSASPYIGWEDVTIGDPLCSPYFALHKNLVTPTPAANYSDYSGDLDLEDCSESGFDIGSIASGSWLSFANVNLTGMTTFVVREASADLTGGVIEVRLDSPTGTRIGACRAVPTGDWQDWTTRTCAITPTTGTHKLYLVFATGGFNLQWFCFR